ncbi:site-2 protease family protein [Candidatus Woesearchaeota archaeon]|nr:site-2 protease family protein [Candidatus Woesearchaeota archaeon]
MNIDIIFAVIFYILLFLFYLFNKNKFEVKGKVLFIYRTKFGIKLMDRIAKKLRIFLTPLSYLSILVGFAGMAFILFVLLRGTFDLLFVPNAQPALAPVLPGVKVPGLPDLSFWHWIITIFIVALIHEFSHGIFARLYKLNVKSSGILALGPILGAFVEPDEEKMKKVPKKEQLAILSAGAFSNIVLAILVFLIVSFVSAPLQEKLMDFKGIEVNSLNPGFPAEKAALPVPFIISSINNKELNNLEDFISATDKIKPNQKLILGTDKGIFNLITTKNPDNNSKGFIGISNLAVKNELKQSINPFFGKAILWFLRLVFWLFVVNLGIGLFNLLPLGPVDGGRMFLVLSSVIFKEERKAQRVWSAVSLFLLMVIFINLLPYLIKFFRFILTPFLG